ncbi:glycosyltransferase family 4 protein [Neisseria gonorrhoeae]|uniref:glycosyltransferase family 4 protein n=3 Tax=Neisseria gonorrhoeae TaxID=485 RepID=UPI001118ABDE|nr:glycosyltransferase family 4 protein [Neisseria gonorrhoeae]TND93104.1 glycosyltransferase [Neisseria gonorrhoeae]
MKLKIDIATNNFKHGGGTERYTLDLVKGLNRQNITPAVYATKFDHGIPEYAMIEPHLVDQRRTLKKLRSFLFSSRLAQTRKNSAAKLIACHHADYADLLICGGTHLGYLHHMAQKPNLLDRLAIRRNRSNYATAKLIVAHSHMMRRELVGLYGVPPERIQVAPPPPPPADTERFFPQPRETAALRAKYGFADHETVFLFPSTGHTRKGLELLADFFEQTELPVKLAVAGSPLPRPMKNVVGLGFCTDMPELYRAADFTIMASLYEPFGLVGVESALCGTRVVLSENMACTEVMNEEAGFFFSRQNPETLAQAVARAVSLKKQGGHRLSDPMRALNYNPSLSHHIDRLTDMLASV